MGTKIGIPVPHEVIAEFCRRHGIRRLAFFGSVLRDDFTPESDVDVLVDIEPGRKLTLFTLAQIENELSDLLSRRVDLHMPRTLHPYLREKVLGQAEDLYVGA